MKLSRAPSRLASVCYNLTMPSKYSPKVKARYNKIAPKYSQISQDTVFLYIYKKWYQLLPPKATILDLGGGTGRDALKFTQKGYQVDLVELSEKMATIAQQTAPKANVVIADMLDYQIKDRFYEGIWANASLLHLTKPEMQTMLHKIHRGLKTSGVFYCSVRTQPQDQEKSVHSPKEFYSKKQITQLLNQYKFHILQSKTIQSDNKTWICTFSRVETNQG